MEAVPANVKRSMLQGIRSGVHELKNLSFDSMSADLGLGQGLKEMTKLADQTMNGVGKNGKRPSPALHRASRNFESALDAESAVADEMTGAMYNSTVAWG